MMTVSRRHVAIGLALTLPCVCPAQAQNRGRGGTWGISWTKIPSIAAVWRVDDAEVQLVRDAVQFWNGVFTELGTTFRLGALSFVVGALPLDQLKALSDKVLSQTGAPELPVDVSQIPGDIIVALSNGDFVSFAARWPSSQKALVAIKGPGSYPMTLSNVARNVIAHELGHAIGLGHNSDPTTLMCGRPASCRPDLFASPTERYFPLTPEEKAMLRNMYSADWQLRR
jgi:hypothetical protein